MASQSTYPAAALVILICLASAAFADLPVTRITGIFPPGGRAGTHFEVAVNGTELGGAAELRFSRPGISAKPVVDAPSATDQRFTVSIDADVPVGACEVRILGAYGISNPRAFVVSDTPEIARAAGAKADLRTDLAVGSVVNARCTASVVDTYAIAIKQGQRVFFTCTAADIDSKLSPVMVLCDDAGHEFERSRHGGFIDFAAPADGTFTLQIHDVLYRGGADYFYRLSASIAPHLDAVFPPMGQPGSKAKYTLYGRNLPGGCKSDLRATDGKLLEQLEIEIELPMEGSAPVRLDAIARAGNSGWAMDAISYRLKSEGGYSNPVLISFALAPVVLEQDHHRAAVRAQRLNPPVEVAGRFYPHGDEDWYTFDVPKGEVISIEMVSQRMGLPTNPSVLIQRVTRDDKGVEHAADVQEVVGTALNATGAAFRSATRDGVARLDVGEAGTYRLLVRDLFNTSVDNSSLMYRLSIRKLRPDFRVVVLPLESAVANDVPLWSPYLRQGGAYPMRVVLSRHDGFNGEVRIDADGLPEGLKCSGTTIFAGQNAGLLVLSATEKASNWCGPVRIIGHAKIGDQEIARDARISAVIWPSTTAAPTDLAVSRVTEDFQVAVSGDDAEPISFQISDEPYSAVVGGKLKIPVKIRRLPAANGPVKITLGGLAPLSTAKELTLAPDASVGELEIDLAQQKLGTGANCFFLQAQGAVNYPRRTFDKNGAKVVQQTLQTTSYSQLITVIVAAKDK